MRFEFHVIQEWIKPKARVLDLGCGDGVLLKELKNNKQVDGLGLEIDEHNITQCIGNGLNVVEQNLDAGLANFQSNSFDTVVMTQTLQAVHYPHIVLDEMLRVGKECIITFPNFGHWLARTYLALRGRMPVSKFMPYTWYDTPNIHFCTVNDFEALCRQKNIHILHRMVVNHEQKSSFAASLWPNLFGATAIYHVTK